MLRLVPYKRNEFERSFEDMFQMMDNMFNQEEKVLRLKLDVSENDKAYLVEAEVPGIKRDQITIDVEKDVLVIKVEKEVVNEEEKKNYIRKERHSSSMQRALRFEAADFENIQAKLEDGILKVIVPKQVEMEQKKRIEIQ
ncbi:MAG: Hsp20 family protein [Clostridia bacterium]|nr:Hsp20 family protein [Clostridia bacterium]